MSKGKASTVRGRLDPSGIHGYRLAEGEWFPAVATPGDGLMTETLQHQISRGLVAGAKSVFVPGYNPDVGVALEDITESGEVVVPVPAAAILMEVVSSAAADTSPAGAGVRTVEIHGLDNNFDEITEVVAMNGVVPVPTILSFRRINAFHAVTTGGVGVTAAGNIDIQDVGGGDIYSRIGAGGNMSLQAHYTVPNGKAGFICGWQSGAISDKTVVGRILLRATADWDQRTVLPGIFLFQDIMVHSGATSARTFQTQRRVPATADVKVSAQKQLGAQSLEVAASIDLWIEDE